MPPNTPQAYRIRRASQLNKDAVQGTTVYLCRGYDYGLASDDTRATGIEHVSVTMNSNGDYPSFTIPLRDLEKVTT